MTCTCGLGHRGWEKNLCRIELFKRAGAAKTIATTAPVPKIKTILSVPNAPVSVKKPKNKPVTRDGKQKTDWASKAVQTVTRDNSSSRMAELRKRKAATGLIEVRGIWTHPDYIEAIKACAKKLNE